MTPFAQYFDMPRMHRPSDYLSAWKNPWKNQDHPSNPFHDTMRNKPHVLPTIKRTKTVLPVRLVKNKKPDYVYQATKDQKQEDPQPDEKT
jgi:hypothetical protein